MCVEATCKSKENRNKGLEFLGQGLKIVLVCHTLLSDNYINCGLYNVALRV